MTWGDFQAREYSSTWDLEKLHYVSAAYSTL